MIDKRPAFFGKLMPKEPDDDVLVEHYHQVNNAYDKYPERRNDITRIEEHCAICSNGDKLAI